MNAIEILNLSKNYPLSGSQTARLRRLFSANPGLDDGIWALKDVSFSVSRGEAFGIIGANGSGKSTLLQMIAGILRPTTGSIHVGGRLSALLELGSGFSPEFTGRDNVYLNGSILGLSRDEIDRRFETIERFAEIGDFIDQPVKTYSTGMVLRLAFSVVAHVDPEILIVDEALAVGDISFRQRCMRRIHDLRARGVTILFVSHETSDVKALCERCLWLQNGAVQQIGESDEVVSRYMEATLRRELAHGREPDSLPGNETPEPEVVIGMEGRHRFGDGRVSMIGADLVAENGASVRSLLPYSRVTLRVSFRLHSAVGSLIAGFLVRNGKGETIFGSNTARENYPVPVMHGGQIHTVAFHWSVPELKPGHYSLSLGIADGNVEEYRMCDYVEDAVNIAIGPHPGTDEQPVKGYFQLHCAAVSVQSG